MKRILVLLNKGGVDIPVIIKYGGEVTSSQTGEEKNEFVEANDAIMMYKSIVRRKIKRDV